MLNVVWFKRDLRVRDHRALADAVAQGMVIPLYIIEPGYWAQDTVSARQWRFTARALTALRTQLAILGAPLVVRVGEAVQVMEDMRQSGADMVLWSHEETGDAWTSARDQQVTEWARDQNVPWHEYPQAGVVRQLESRDDWAAEWERRMSAPVVETPELMIAHGVTPGKIVSERILYLPEDPCVDIPAGPGPARNLLDQFLCNRVSGYRRGMASPMTAADTCSRLSPHLALGTISTREVYQAAKAAHADAAPGPERLGMSSFMTRLHWRCHFMQNLQDAPEIETHCMHPAFEGLREDDHDEDRLIAWLTGQTGLPLVDACMRSLRATGWLTFRMRAMVASVAAYHLWLDWRAFGPGLAQLFTDYETGIHWAQCQTQSGVTGLGPVRVCDPVQLGEDYDPDGAFIREWLPELANVPAPLIHRPWTMTQGEQSDLGCTIGQDYPAPIVDHEAAAQQGRALVEAVVNSDAFAADQKRVIEKHAARRRP